MFRRRLFARSDPRAPAALTAEALFREYAAFAWRVLRRMGVAERDVDDVCQEVFVTVHRRIETFEGRSSPRTWLYGICVRTASDYRKRAVNRHETVGDSSHEATIDANQESDAALREARATLDRILDGLDDDKRAVFVLYEIEELPMTDVAIDVGCPIQTAYSAAPCREGEDVDAAAASPPRDGGRPMSDPTRLSDPESESPASLRQLIEAGRSDVPDTERLRGLAGSLGYGAGAVSAGAGAGAVKGAAIGLGGGATKIGVVAVLVLGAGAGATALATRDIPKTQATAVAAPSAAGRTSPSSLQPRLDPVVTGAAPSSPEPTSPPTEDVPFAPSTSMANDTSPIGVSNAKPSVGTAPKVVPLATASAATLAGAPVMTEGIGPRTAQPDDPPPETEFSLLEQAQRALRSDPQRALGLADADEKRDHFGSACAGARRHRHRSTRSTWSS